jgi:hypothetical protein
MDDLERRGSERRPPDYTRDQIEDLRITRVHFRETYMFCLLSDGKMVCVPLTISSALQAAPPELRYQWQISDQGKSLIWHTKGMGIVTERISLAAILDHPEAQIMNLPDQPS